VVGSDGVRVKCQSKITLALDSDPVLTPFLANKRSRVYYVLAIKFSEKRMSVIIITGSSSGFGLEAALSFARNGDTVIATMRDIGKAGVLLERAAAEKLELQVKPLDVTHSDTFASFVESIIEQHGQIDVLVNNAGIHRSGALEDHSEASFRQVMETNCIGPVLLTRAVLPQMRIQNNGLIIMMSSLSGVAGLPGDLPYSSSKFGLEGATEALRHEVDRWNIRVALVQAGSYKTDIMDHNLDGSSTAPPQALSDSPYRPLIEWQLKNLRDGIAESLDPKIVADLFVTIANSGSSQLRWPADPVAVKVLETMLGQNDQDRDDFLRGVAGSDWWSQGEENPPE
jgi:NAD(P)-dependent dehydrogenase (short-subunit alcohol dehydrogenase family)